MCEVGLNLQASESMFFLRKHDFFSERKSCFCLDLTANLFLENTKKLQKTRSCSWFHLLTTTETKKGNKVRNVTQKNNILAEQNFKLVYNIWQKYFLKPLCFVIINSVHYIGILCGKVSHNCEAWCFYLYISLKVICTVTFMSHNALSV